LHGVGVSVVNALSEWLDLTIWRDGEENYMRFRIGDAEAPLSGFGPRRRAARGPRSPSCPALRPSRSPSSISTSSSIAFASSPSSTRACASVLTDARHEERSRSSCFYEGGIAAFVRYLDRAKTALIPEPISVHRQRDDIGIDVALEWNDCYYEQFLCFTNNIPQRDGGTHLAAFRRR
jgi:DNA gyrase subunit B